MFARNQESQKGLAREDLEIFGGVVSMSNIKVERLEDRSWYIQHQKTGSSSFLLGRPRQLHTSNAINEYLGTYTTHSIGYFGALE